MHNVVKWPNKILKSCSVLIVRFLKYVWPFYNINEGLKGLTHWVTLPKSYRNSDTACVTGEEKTTLRYFFHPFIPRPNKKTS